MNFSKDIIVNDARVPSPSPRPGNADGRRDPDGRGGVVGGGQRRRPPLRHGRRGGHRHAGPHDWQAHDRRVLR